MLDEAAWMRASPISDFRQQDPLNGEPATERTEVRIVYDEQRLIVGVICFDSEPGRVMGNQMQRDQSFGADDRFIFTIDTYLDGRSGYYFEVNPSGAMGDGLIAPGGTTTVGAISINRSWDGNWNARVGRRPDAWTAEIEVPFRIVNFDPNAATWGINFQRTVRRKNEEVLWAGYARNLGVTYMSAAGRLMGLSSLSQGLGLDVRPYVIGSSGAAPGRNQTSREQGIVRRRHLLQPDGRSDGPISPSILISLKPKSSSARSTSLVFRCSFPRSAPSSSRDRASSTFRVNRATRSCRSSAGASGSIRMVFRNRSSTDSS